MQNTRFSYLYPISPLQIKNSTLINTTAQNPGTTPINSPECKMVSWSLLGGRYCSATFNYHTVAISDYYVTNTGETVKATSIVTYREDRDYMTTRVSLGHTLINGFMNSNGVMVGPVPIPGDTYAVNKNAFVCIVPTAAGDHARMANEIAGAMNAGLLNGFARNGDLWVRVR
jgi:hypothetical protein